MNISRLQFSELVDGILKRDRIVLAKAITLVESSLQADQKLSAELIDTILPYTGRSIRVAITGAPGVGKSTFIEAFGQHLLGQGHKVAILTIDPSSQVTKGSILGDKTRMADLSKNSNAFIRPSASGDTLGGVGHKTREAILLCEAAGYDVVIVETVGVGQSEIAVNNMVDFFLLLMLAGAGDELQGIKKGIMEIADAVVITKADGENVSRATEAQAEYQQALHYHPEKKSGWTARVLTCSALSKTGVDKVWDTIAEFKRHAEANGYLLTNREAQNVSWYLEQFFALLKDDITNSTTVNEYRKQLQDAVADKGISPRAAAMKLLERYHEAVKLRK